MEDTLKNYLSERGAKKLDPELLKEHLIEMTEDVIPKIMEDAKERDQMAAELRYSPTISTRSRKDR